MSDTSQLTQEFARLLDMSIVPTAYNLQYKEKLFDLFEDAILTDQASDAMIASLREERDEREVTIQQMNDRILEIQQQLSWIQQDLQFCQSELEDAQSSVAELSQERLNLQYEVDDLKNELQDKDKEISRLEDTVFVQKDLIVELEDRVEFWKDEAQNRPGDD